MAPNPDLPSPPNIAGLCLDGRQPVVISAEENRRLCETMGIEPDPNGEAHPSYYYIATQVGMKLTVAELCAACAFDVEQGPMMATSSAKFLMPLMTEQPYLVRGQVIGLSRKASRSLGVMDLLDYWLCLDTIDGKRALEVRNLWALPRSKQS